MSPIDPNSVWYQDFTNVLGVFGFFLSLFLAYFEVKKRIEDQKPQLTYFIRQREGEVGVAEIVLHNSGGSVAFNIVINASVQTEDYEIAKDVHFFAKDGAVKINCLPPRESVVYPFAVGFKILRLTKPICLKIQYAINSKTNIREKSVYRVGVDEIAPILKFSVYPSSRKLNAGVVSIANSIKKLVDDKKIISVYVIDKKEKTKIDQSEEDRYREIEEYMEKIPDRIEEK